MKNITQLLKENVKSLLLAALVVELFLFALETVSIKLPSFLYGQMFYLSRHIAVFIMIACAYSLFTKSQEYKFKEFFQKYLFLPIIIFLISSCADYLTDFLPPSHQESAFSFLTNNLRIIFESLAYTIFFIKLSKNKDTTLLFVLIFPLLAVLIFFWYYFPIFIMRSATPYAFWIFLQIQVIFDFIGINIPGIFKLGLALSNVLIISSYAVMLFLISIAAHVILQLTNTR